MTPAEVLEAAAEVLVRTGEVPGRWGTQAPAVGAMLVAAHGTDWVQNPVPEFWKALDALSLRIGSPWSTKLCDEAVAAEMRYAAKELRAKDSAPRPPPDGEPEQELRTVAARLLRLEDRFVEIEAATSMLAEIADRIADRLIALESRGQK